MTLGIIGCGKMAQALLGGATRAGVLADHKVLFFDPAAEAREAFAKVVPDGIDSDFSSLESESDALLFCVKPHAVLSILSDLQPRSEGRLIISIAAGIALSALEETAQADDAVVRVMPNTPALVGEAASAVSFGKNVTDRHKTFVRSLLTAVGTLSEVPENLMDAVTGLSGSGPAYVFTIIEALTDAGVLNGLPRPEAKTLATQTLLGATKMVAESDDHPAALRDMVTSPGGTTIAGLAALEKGGLRATLQDAVTAATRRSRELGA